MMKKKKVQNNRVLKERQTRYLSQAIQLDEALTPNIMRNAMLVISLSIFCFIAWSAITNINEIARSPGEVVPQGNLLNIQHLEGGIIDEILVREGEIVKRGQPLIRLSNTGIKEDIARAQSKLNALIMQEERLRAFVDNRAPDFSDVANAADQTLSDQQDFFESMRTAREQERKVIENQIAQKREMISALQSDINTERQNFSIVKDVYEKRKSLNKLGYTSEIKLLESQQQLNSSRGNINRLLKDIDGAKEEIQEAESRLLSKAALHRDTAHERLDSILTEKAQTQKVIEKLQHRSERLEIRSPGRGLVKGLKINTIGSVVQPGQTLLEIVPLDKELLVSVKIPPQHIGHVRLGQKVHVKFSSFDFSRYGYTNGKLDQVSAATFTDDTGARYYQGLVSLEKNYVGVNKANIIMPGMTVMADIITGKKTILEYLLKPIHLSIQTAFTER